MSISSILHNRDYIQTIAMTVASQFYVRVNVKSFIHVFMHLTFT